VLKPGDVVLQHVLLTL